MAVSKATGTIITLESTLMRESSTPIEDKEEVRSTTAMEIFIRGIGIMVRNMGKECCSQLQEIVTKAHFTKVVSTGLARKDSAMVTTIKESSNQASWKAKAFISGQTAQSTEVASKMVCCMGWESGNRRKMTATKVNIVKIRSTDMEPTNGTTAWSSQATSQRTSK